VRMVDLLGSRRNFVSLRPMQGRQFVNPIRCGRCIAEDHAQCVGRITMGTPKATYTWHCDCLCHAEPGRRDAVGPRGTRPSR
jgi:hypothetical protein